MTWQGGKPRGGPPFQTTATPFARLKPLLTGKQSGLEESFQSMAHALRNYASPVRIHVRVVSGESGETVEHWEVQGGSSSAKARRTKNEPKDADVLVVMRPETWTQIAQGQLAPFDALFAGKLRVGGNLQIAKSITQHLSDPTVPFVPPC